MAKQNNMTNYRIQFKKVIYIIVILFFFLYIYMDCKCKPRLTDTRDRFNTSPYIDAEYNLSQAYFVDTPKLTDIGDRFNTSPHVDAKYNTTQAYFVDTPGCRMPSFNVTDNTIVKYISKPENFTCKKPLTRTSNEGSWLLINMDAQEILERYNVSDLSQAKCYYNEFKRETGLKNQYMKRVEFQLQAKEPIEIKAGTEFIRVRCENLKGGIFYEDYHFFVVEKTETKSTPSKLTENVTAKVPDVEEKVSVMILGIDGVSHLNFLRQMKQTSAFIHKHLSHVEFWGYNKVGDNTYPNLVPALSGLDVKELNMSCLSPYGNINYDKCAFIWKKFKKAGYKTVFAEDVAWLGLFNYFRPGFGQQPTDYYTHPIMKEMEDHISYMHFSNVELCKGGRRSVDVILEYIRKLIPLLKRQLFFSFFWLTTLSHDDLDTPMLLDLDVTNLLQAFAEEGIFNNTVVFLMSDHGLRWGPFRDTYQGMMEERQPLLIPLYPSWMRQKYPIAIANMEHNSKRLTTHFDLYATMVDLIDLHNLETTQLEARATELQEAETLPRSISLFLPIPETRSCELAGIASHWCTCHQKQELPTNDSRVEHAARFIVSQMNDKLKAYPQCRRLYLNNISEAIIATSHNEILKEVISDYSIDITVRVQTKPGLGEFESTVRMSNSSSTVLTGTISRVNLYGNQSYCINDYVLKKFCYCHTVNSTERSPKVRKANKLLFF